MQYVNMDDKFRIRLKIHDHDLKRQIAGILAKAGDFVIAGSQDGLRINLMFYELNSNTPADMEKDFHIIQTLLETGEAKEIFLFSRNSDQSTLLNAIKAGAREFFHIPSSDQEIQNALDKFTNRRRQDNRETEENAGRILTFIGSKGGVGTTTLAVNIGVQLAAEKRVVLMDMNQVFGEICHFLDMDAPYSWGEIAKNFNRLDSTFLLQILTRHPSGVYALPSPGYLCNELSASPEIIEYLLNIMKSMFDFIVIDAGQSLDNMSLKILGMSDQINVVSILSVPCLSNTKKLLKSLESLDVPVSSHTKVLINRYLDKSAISVKDAEKAIEHPIYWTIPNDYRTTVTAINRGVTLDKVAPRSPINKNIRLLADAIQGKSKKAKKGFFR